MAAPRKRRWAAVLLPVVLLPALLLLLALAAAILVLQAKGITPRALSPYVDKRASGHNDMIMRAGTFASRSLVALDRGAPTLAGPLPAGLGAQLAGSARTGREVLVGSVDEVRAAFAAAQPGDLITFIPGTYRFRNNVPAARRPGSEASPVVVRAAVPGTVRIELDAVEGFLVSAPWWIFENLSVRGVCAADASCEHAFHVVSSAHHFVSLNNTITDFNAHFKINGVAPRFPDHGRIEANTLTNSAVRRTANPVTPIDLVGASHWVIRGNLIADFVKGEGDRVSYGAFAKGAGENNLFEANAVLCERTLRGLPGQRVGLSLGGGGTGKPYCRDGRCITEQDKSELRGNLVAGCSDAGIYLNSASASRIVHNTVIDTAGIQARHPETSAHVEGNLVDGALLSRNGAVVRPHDNLVSPIAYAFTGYHPVRSLYRAPLELDFSWSGEVPRRAPGTVAPATLCGTPRPAAPAYGAIENYAACSKASGN